MKKTIPFFLTAVFLLGGCVDSSNEYVSADNTQPTNFSTVTSETDSIKSKTLEPRADEEVLEDEREGVYSIVSNNFIQGEVNVKYPQIQGLGDNDREMAINSLIKDNLFESEINNQLKEVKEVVEKHGIDEDYYLELEYEVTLHTDKLLSILYTGIGALKTSAFPTYSIYAITIDLENVTTLNLSDFIDIDKTLIEKMKASTNVTNGSVKDGMDKESLLRTVQIVTEQDEDYIIKVFKEGGGGYYTFAVTPDSLIISISIAHAAGDYALIEVNR